MFTKLIHFAKMSWMLYWRLLVIGTIFFASRHNDIFPWVAIGIAAISVFVFNQTLLTWPVLRFFTGKRNLIPADSWGSNAETAPTKTPRSSNRRPGRPHVGTPGISTHAEQPLATATRNGRITGYEPRNLQSQPVPKAVTMYGVPGEGLHGASGMTQQNIGLGVQGEENFARALANTGDLQRFTSVWSVPVPDQNSFTPGPYGTDIDCVLGTGSAIFLIDLKNYKSGDVRYHARGNQLYCEDVPTGKQVGAPKTMSRNMEMATNAMKAHFPKANIVPVVVFMPTDKGEGLIDDVSWPGGVLAMNLSDFLNVLANQQNFDWKLPHSGVIGRISNLLSMNAANKTM